MRNHFIFDGEDSRDYGVYISGSGVFDAPARKGQKVSIPGRSGSLFIDENGAFENITIKYPAFIVRNFANNMSAFRNMMLSKSGYVRLQDTYNPNEYRLARYDGGIEAKMLDNLKAGEFELKFDCYPQRYLKNGEDELTFTAAGTIINPSLFASKPLLAITGKGVFGLGTHLITITGTATQTIYIDCESMEIYTQAGGIFSPASSLVSFNTNSFPDIQSGENGVALGSGIIKAVITPRWWRL